MRRRRSPIRSDSQRMNAPASSMKPEPQQGVEAERRRRGPRRSGSPSCASRRSARAGWWSPRRRSRRVGSWVSIFRVSAERSTISRHRPGTSTARSSPRQNACVASKRASVSAAVDGHDLLVRRRAPPARTGPVAARRRSRSATTSPSSMRQVGRRGQPQPDAVALDEHAAVDRASSVGRAPGRSRAAARAASAGAVVRGRPARGGRCAAGARRRAPQHGHEVVHLDHALVGEEAGDQDVGVGQVELVGPDAAVDRRRASTHPPCSASRMRAKTLGESKRGAQNQSMLPSVPTRRTCAGRRSARGADGKVAGGAGFRLRVVAVSARGRHSPLIPNRVAFATCQFGHAWSAVDY